MIAAIQYLQGNSPALLIDLPPLFDSHFRPTDSNMFTGMDLHRSVTSAVRGREVSRDHASITERLLSWLWQTGVNEIRPEVNLDHPDVRGNCDLLVRGGYNDTGIIEIKACNEVPDYALSKHRMQLSLYLYAVATRNRGESGCWGAIAYCSLVTGHIRLFVWPDGTPNRKAMYRALKLAA